MRTGLMTPIAREVEAISIQEWGERRAVSMVGLAPGILEVQEKVAKIAAFDEPVLITGESGVGKESLAQALYLLGARRGRPFVAVNCPQYQDGNLTVSELFGHKRGSFTGAVADRKGCFEVADGGVIFLDEIADLHMSAQVMLLRALAFGEFQPLGAQQTTTVNVRVVAATNRSIDKLVVAESFRNDLFFRLRYFHIRVPALRERGDDWCRLVDYVLARLRAQYGVDKRLAPESLEVLRGYDWPGNVRELSSIVTTGYALCDGQLIEPKDFVSHLEQRGVTGQEDLYHRVTVAGEDFWTVVHDPFIDREINRAQVRTLIRQGLARTDGSYRRLLDEFRVRHADYQRFMDFLRHHRLKP
jgi:DNA-binding NtrC family response regulator